MPCTTILVGKKASYDGSTIIARNDDGPFDTKRVTVMKPAMQPKVYKSVISHVSVELPENPLQYTYCPTADKKNGIWPACGINEVNVAMTATETITSNPRVIAADPYVVYKPKKGREKEVPGGIGEEDLVVLVLPYIKTAKEGVFRMGELLKKYGTYEANGMAFSDEKEVWWLETIGGHHFIARRVPDDHVVIMPNQFGLDHFDFEDAFGKQEEFICSEDLKDFIENNHLDLRMEGEFNPRLAFGSHSDSDHIYNTPRAWYMARYFLPGSYLWDGEQADFTPESNDIPWSFVPEQKVTIEDVRYVLGSHYQGTPYDPYDHRAALRGKYRSIGVPNSDVCGILQIRGYMPPLLQGVEWISLGGSTFTACFPLYSNVDKMPGYVSETTEEISTDYMYWQSRLIAALTDAHINTALIYDERYLSTVSSQGRTILREYDEKFAKNPDGTLLKEANKKITDMVKKESDKVLDRVLKNASEHMKNRYHRGDN